LPWTASAARLAPFLLVAALLGATAAAFAVTEGLKLEPSPIRSTQVDKIFSPDVRVAHIRFRLRKPDRLTLAIVDSHDRVVRTLIDGRRFNRGPHGFTWNGRDDAGEVVPDDAYRPRVHLGAQHRTILLPNPIAVDTKPPTAVLTIRRREITPGRSRVQAYYRLSEPARAILLANGKRVVGPSYFHPVTGKLEWFATGVRAGTYRLSLRALDLAGNLGPATKAVPVRIVYLELARHRLHVKPGGAVAVRFGPIDTAHWLLNGHAGIARHGRLRIKAPAEPGTYTLYVRTGGHADRATVIVG
jgi:hypothetical protein